ncbi:MAG: RNA-binding S4 domain-containing protein [Desulfobacteraceae bacterium]|nr:MAG: RNA-binding S4 domain-containing protein [Desulfobacteraceae bacterium]
MNIAFQITGEYIELIKLLKAAGLCATGGMAKIVIEEGRVSVDGRTELRKRCKIKKGQSVAFEGHTVEVQ